MRRAHRSLVPVAALGAASFLFTLAPAAPPPPVADGTWRVVAWNDLGMHCMDADYSVFSILPPFNTVQAQTVLPSGRLGTPADGLTLTYEAVPDPEGSFNATSQGKTDYWSFADVLYGGSTTPDVGLAGYDMPGSANVPQAMGWDPARSLWSAEGVPITPLDSQGRTRNYPLMRIVARASNGSVVASADVVLPVSAEMDCRACHASGSGPDAEPAAGWVYDANGEHDYRRNVLRLHDELHLGETTFDQALTQAGYQSAGLLATADAGQPILCASCHRSNALPGTGQAGITQLTIAMHAKHAGAKDPESGLALDDVAARSACYTCHPGSETRCLRGAMGAAVASDGELAMQCQSCHGGMSKVGDVAREGWLEQPNCQACHTGTATSNNGQIRYTSAFEPSGALRVAVDDTFATDPDAPAPGFSLYRFSAGHGGLTCEACHGSTHAEYPGLHGNDNLQMIALQGHAGTLSECTTCHVEQPEVAAGGPHGLHPVGDFWVDHHTDAAEKNLSACRDCHGTDYRGTVLSRILGDRDLHTPWGTKSWFRGAQVSCYGCHDGPHDDDASTNSPAVVQDAAIEVAQAPVPVALVASDPNGDPLTLRIVSQPTHGRVGVAGTTATYHPDPGFAGTDAFTFAAWDGSVESNLGTVTVTRRASWSTFGSGYPGTGGIVPALTADAPPAIGSHVTILLGNPTSGSAPALVFTSNEYASIPTAFGGMAWLLPQAVVPIVVPPGGASIGWSIPNNPTVVGYVLHGQAVVLDAGALFGLAFTPALRLVLGT